MHRERNGVLGGEIDFVATFRFAEEFACELADARLKTSNHTRCERAGNQRTQLGVDGRIEEDEPRRSRNAGAERFVVGQRAFDVVVAGNDPGVEWRRHAQYWRGGSQLFVNSPGIAAGIVRKKVHQRPPFGRFQQPVTELSGLRNDSGTTGETACPTAILGA